ncbi:RNA 2',3'-cyclic phosphodiesterase [Photobacterium galatheae]|uniref:RNA 2',3'-cyclic phosphodiesterase n=1 Tax=Photobacterium galatheae TaxID=1654360 RepID=A0A066RZA3_9GAMM|nr:RNA 2',3'-cyclic phosphodiesterase [Photobacterium galatheae]KDM92693.1 hypothetical protein EA58_04820 [Photobacterium galatheae]MCM0149389.1 RNA 2',3'-cyclic phosphodiesterase [Photobacterium galatheae]
MTTLSDRADQNSTDVSQRMFFALPLNEPPAANQTPFQRLCQLKESFPGKGRTVPDANLHLTLAFLGQVTTQQRDQLLALVDPLEIPAFAILFNHLGYWKRSKVLWLGSEETPDALLMLTQQLSQCAQAVGLPQEDRTYRPHITLRRNVWHRPAQQEAQDTFHFHFQRFGLYISDPSRSGVNYRLAREWSLISEENAPQDRT